MKKNLLLSLDNISKNYSSNVGEIKVLENISLDIYEHEIVVMIGPSGCGKTTLLNIVAGLLSIDSGEAYLRDDRVLAYIFQEPRFLPWKTVEENIDFVQGNFLNDHRAAKIRFELLSKTGLFDVRDCYPAQLSGGMKQRLEVIRALSISPDLILMDEPFKSLDISLKYQLLDILLGEYSKKPFAMFLVTHDPEDAVLLADKILLLSDKPARINKVLEIGLPRKQRSLKHNDMYNLLQKIFAYTVMN